MAWWPEGGNPKNLCTQNCHQCYQHLLPRLHTHIHKQRIGSKNNYGMDFLQKTCFTLFFSHHDVLAAHIVAHMLHTSLLDRRHGMMFIPPRLINLRPRASSRLSLCFLTHAGSLQHHSCASGCQQQQNAIESVQLHTKP